MLARETTRSTYRAISPAAGAAGAASASAIARSRAGAVGGVCAGVRAVASRRADAGLVAEAEDRPAETEAEDVAEGVTGAAGGFPPGAGGDEVEPPVIAATAAPGPVAASGRPAEPAGAPTDAT
ncbi:hypothetical protein [Streptomyces sp. NPDC006551]|uniref:hypothetical protein n=1 Tax=Streptomyces sp. NPDC006551 TaxID=3157178 RepID=UPI0033B1319D